MSSPHPHSTDRLQARPQELRQQPSLLSIHRDESTPLMQWRGHPYNPLIPNLSPQEHFHPFSSSYYTCAPPPLPESQVHPVFHSCYQEERQYRSFYEPSPTSSASGHSPMTRQRSQTPVHSDFPTPESHRSSPDMSTLDALRASHIDNDHAAGSTIKAREDEPPYSPGVSLVLASASHVRGFGVHSVRTNEQSDLSGTGSPSRLMSSFAWESSPRPASNSSLLRGSRSADFSVDLGIERGDTSVGSTWEQHTGHHRLGASPQCAGESRHPMRGMLPNRHYYPLPHHQVQFDAFALQDASIFQQRESLGLNTLDCEPGQPPLHSMPIIIECAILGSPHQKLTLSELRVTLKKRFRHYEQEEEKGVKSWERTLLQNLSKKSRFINTERSMSEPGQGGYWQVNHSAPPSNRARKRNIKRVDSPVRTRTTFSWPGNQTNHAALIQSRNDTSTIDGPSSLFRSVAAERLPGGRVKGMNERCIVLPALEQTKPEIFPSSPRRWTVATTNNLQLQNLPEPFSQRDNFIDEDLRLSNNTVTDQLSVPRMRESGAANHLGHNQITASAQDSSSNGMELAHPQRRRGNTVSRYPLQRT